MKVNTNIKVLNKDVNVRDTYSAAIEDYGKKKKPGELISGGIFRREWCFKDGVLYDFDVQDGSPYTASVHSATILPEGCVIERFYDHYELIVGYKGIETQYPWNMFL